MKWGRKKEPMVDDVTTPYQEERTGDDHSTVKVLSYAHMHTHTYTHTHAHTYTHAYTHMHTHIHTCTHIHTHAYT